MADIVSCRSCGRSHLRTFLSLGDLPLSDGFIAEADLGKAEPRFPLDVAFCEDCTLVQILKTVPPEELFGHDYPYFSSFTDALVAHARENVEARIRERRLGPDSFVVELASNDGYLLQHYQKAGIPLLGIDPAPGPVEAARKKGIDTRLAFFGLSVAQELAEAGKQADVIHGNNVLAHVADTNGFVQGIAALLKDDGVAVIEAPYVRDLIDHGEFDTIYHEHLCYFSATALKALFRQHGLHFNRVERLPIHGGSLRIFVEKVDRPDASITDLLAEERELGIDKFGYYADFAARVEKIKADLRAMLLELKAEGKTIVGYGAAAKGTILLNYAGIGPDLLDYVVDRNTFKQGRWIPGVRLPIKAPAVIEETKPDYLLILPWNFKDEIMSQQAAHAARGGKFILPIPMPVIV
ncbi:MAG TPA: class I SAM-dependent methyltransferase [Geminicoccus sp.]|uniref:class I SAM-dependent methyltransferase n=1 Tax=Geminicoccus sp. TaxID=2024832 RepID=UPI002C9FB0E3|nr:class I SAM-dependent methyltransferase [Geminicoccus sp.]HWL71890.1 class I SAM-dependent methyltransferase [Geminicoccus sp.]